MVGGAAAAQQPPSAPSDDPVLQMLIERTGTVRRALDLHAEVNGFVVVKNVVQGMRIMPTDTLFEIADFSRVWMMADVYDSDISAVRVGSVADIAVSSLPGGHWSGAVTFASPTVEEHASVGLDWQRQQQCLGPVFGYSVSTHWTIRVAPTFGLFGVSDPFMLRMGVGYSFDRLLRRQSPTS